jgi:DUF1365 family protein
MNSRFYTGTVAHARTLPVRNRFTYGVYFCYLDLAELDDLDDSLQRFGHNRKALVSFYDADHGPHDGSPLRPWLDALLTQVRVDLEGGQVCILTIPRVLGERFYPVSFWYCFHRDGTPRAILAEVRNTFGDHHNYLIHEYGQPLSWDMHPEKRKAFYVSPFVQREDVDHLFGFTAPGDTVSVTVNDRIDGKIVLGTTLSLKAEELTDRALIRAVLRMGPMSARALVLIHWQALKLFAKRAPFFPHTPPPDEEVSL